MKNKVVCPYCEHVSEENESHFICRECGRSNFLTEMHLVEGEEVRHKYVENT